MLRISSTIFVGLVVLAGACQASNDSNPPTRSTTQPTVAPVDSVPASSRSEQAAAEADPTPDGQLVLEVVREFPHDTDAWTQGYLIEQDRLFESTGDFQSSESTLREVDPETGEVLRSVNVGEPYFSEGIEQVGDRIYMITWQDNTAFVFGRETFEVEETFTYQGEGWGLCLDDHDGNNRLVMSDGSETLTFRDPETFEATSTLQIDNDGSFRLNELECVDGFAYANVWTTNIIVRIDLETGEIASTIDASELKTRLGGAGNILNGIAYDEASNTFLLTGKFWPSAFEVRFVPR